LGYERAPMARPAVKIPVTRTRRTRTPRSVIRERREDGSVPDWSEPRVFY
jgi:hypothetical protein